MTQNNHEALQNLKAKAPHEADDVTGVGGDESVSEALSKNVFSSYVCTSVRNGVPHPGDIAEPTSLRYGMGFARAPILHLPLGLQQGLVCSAIALPATSYPLWDSIPADVVNSGKLSQLQLEGVLYACTKHQQFLPSGERKHARQLHTGFGMLVAFSFEAFCQLHRLRWETMQGTNGDTGLHCIQVLASSLVMEQEWARGAR